MLIDDRRNRPPVDIDTGTLHFFPLFKSSNRKAGMSDWVVGDPASDRAFELFVMLMGRLADQGTTPGCMSCGNEVDAISDGNIVLAALLGSPKKEGIGLVCGGCCDQPPAYFRDLFAQFQLLPTATTPPTSRRVH